MESLEFHQNASTCRVGTLDSMVAEKISIKKKPGIWYQDGKKDGLGTSEESTSPHSSQGTQGTEVIEG